MIAVISSSASWSSCVKVPEEIEAPKVRLQTKNGAEAMAFPTYVGLTPTTLSGLPSR
jgi:hypothetical protein